MRVILSTHPPTLHTPVILTIHFAPCAHTIPFSVVHTSSHTPYTHITLVTLNTYHPILHTPVILIVQTLYVPGELKPGEVRRTGTAHQQTPVRMPFLVGYLWWHNCLPPPPLNLCCSLQNTHAAGVGRVLLAAACLCSGPVHVGRKEFGCLGG